MPIAQRYGALATTSWLIVAFGEPGLVPLSAWTGEGSEETEWCLLPPAVGSPRHTFTDATGCGRPGWPQHGRPSPAAARRPARRAAGGARNRPGHSPQSGPTPPLLIWGVMPTREWFASSSNGNCHAGFENLKPFAEDA